MPTPGVPYRVRGRPTSGPNSQPITPLNINSDVTNTVSITGSINVSSLYPTGATPMISASGNVANATGSASLNGFASATTYLSGFEVTGAGATAGNPVIVTVTGLSATLSYIYTAVAGTQSPNASLVMAFNPPLPASAVSTAIVVSCPPLGAGSTHNAVVARGFRV